jgi:hypothetical protein
MLGEVRTAILFRGREPPSTQPVSTDLQTNRAVGATTGLSRSPSRFTRPEPHVPRLVSLSSVPPHGCQLVEEAPQAPVVPETSSAPVNGTPKLTP